MTRPADAKKTVGTLASFGAAGVAAAAAVGYFNAPAGAPSAGAQAAASAAVAEPLAKRAPLGPAAAAPPVPVSLEGTTPPRLPVDALGHLRKARGVRDFFDYFLAAQNEVRADALDALVEKQIAAQLDGAAAALEALDVWRRYAAYRQALAALAPLSTTASAGGLDLDALQSQLDRHVSLASRTLGGEWSEAFFGADWRRARYTIERWRIVRDATLTEAQKSARLGALVESLPPDERAAVEGGQRARAAVETIAKLEQQGGSIEALRAQATQALGPQAAERIVKMRRENDAWRTKYAGYAAQRARIEAMALSPAERDAQIEGLRKRAFSNPAEALRAASLDRTSAR